MIDFGFSAKALVFLVVCLLLFGFWIGMLARCFTNPLLSFRSKIIWLIVIFLGTWVGALIYALARPSELRALISALARPSQGRPWRMRRRVAASVAGVLLLIGAVFVGLLIERQRLQEAMVRQSRESTVKRLEALLALNQATRDGDATDVAVATATLNAGDAMSSAKAYAKAAVCYQEAKELAERAVAKMVEGARSTQAARRAAEEALRAAQKVRQQKEQALLQALRPAGSTSQNFAPRGWLSIETFNHWTQGEFAAAQEALETGNAKLSAKAYTEAKASYERAKALAAQAAATVADVSEVFTTGIKASDAIDAAANAPGRSFSYLLPGNVRTTSEFSAAIAARDTAYESMRAKAYKDAASAFAKAQELAVQFAKTAEPLGRRLDAAVEEALTAMQVAESLGAKQYVPSAWKEASDLFYFISGSQYKEEPGSGIGARLEMFIATYEKAKERFDRAATTTKAMKAAEAAMKLAEACAVPIHAPSEWKEAQDALRAAEGRADDEKAANAEKVTKLFQQAAVAATAALDKTVQAASQERQSAAKELDATIVAWAFAHGVAASAEAYTRQSVPPPAQKEFEALDAATQAANTLTAALPPYLVQLDGGADGDPLAQAVETLTAALQDGGQQPVAQKFVEAGKKQLQAKEIARRLTRMLKALQSPVTLRSAPAKLSQNDVVKIIRERFHLPTTTLGLPPVANEKVEDFQNVYDLQELKGDPVVVDYVTDLMWVASLTPPGFVIKPKKWAEAAEHLGKLNHKDRAYAGFSDWRLPTIEELLSLVELQKNSKGEHIDELFNLSLSRFVFPNFWSSDTDAYSSQLQWAVAFTPVAHVTKLSIDPGLEPSGWVLAVRKAERRQSQ